MLAKKAKFGEEKKPLPTYVPSLFVLAFLSIIAYGIAVHQVGTWDIGLDKFMK